MDFDESEYCQRLIQAGTPPDQAADVASRTAAARLKSNGAPSIRTVVPPVSRDLAFDDPAPASAGVDVADALPVLAPLRRVRKDAEMITASAQIAQEPPTGDDLAFLHGVLCQVGLPRSRVDGTEFTRRSGAAALSVTAGKLWNGEEFVQQIVPYGTFPRLILAWMNTYAVRHKTAEIPVGDTPTEFMKMLGRTVSGGDRGTMRMFKLQVNALAACRITLGFNRNGRAVTFDGKPITSFEAWISERADQPTLWPGIVRFSPEYMTTLETQSVPLDWRALSMLQGSALAMDIYTTWSHRLHRITAKEGLLLSWANLRQQFGQEYQGKEAGKDFKKKFLPALRDVLAVYPEARVESVYGGIRLMRSPPPIPYKPD